MIAYHALFLIVFVGTTAFFTGLSILNLRYGERTVRKEAEWVAETLDVEDVERLIDYQRTKTRLSLAQTWVLVAIVLAILYSGAFAAVVERLEATGIGPLAAGIVFFVGITVALQVFSLPFDAVDTFVVEERFGFNQTTPGLFLRDAALGLLIGSLFVAVLGGGVLFVIERFPSVWWLAALLLYVGFSLTMLVIYPRVIAPLFNDFEPVESDDLREAVTDVFERAGFSTSAIYVMDASRRSSHSNAYFTGFGRTKRVVLFDTLLSRLSVSEVKAVLAHELAHWKYGHVWRRFVVGSVRVGVVLFVFWYLLQTNWLYSMFDVPLGVAYAGLIVAALWVRPLSKLTRPLENRLSLKHEREADAFAVDVMEEGTALSNALQKLAGENLSNPFPHPVYAEFHYSHPPLPDRMRYIRDRSGSQ